MSDAVALDLFIQDFVQTNIVMNVHYEWDSLTNRRFLTSAPRVFRFTSGEERLAIGRVIELPDGDWYRIELSRPLPVAEHTFNCLRMMAAATHTGLDVETVGETVLVKLTTRHRGLINVVFVIRDAPLASPFLV
jgi:hypothetical protein